MQVRMTWIKEILNKKWAASFRPRIALRHRLGRPFTEEELDQHIETLNSDGLTPEPVDSAFRVGEIVKLFHRLDLLVTDIPIFRQLRFKE
jgi:hypothetical protein